MSKFAVFFGNRGFFSETLISGARAELDQALTAQGHQALMLPESATRFGAIETPEEGQKFARLIDDNRKDLDGVIVCLPNFGDETGAVAACEKANMPIFIQAYPDEMDKMDMSQRRDAFCGKFSVMDMFYQYNIPFTIAEPHTVHPLSELFSDQLRFFSQVCNVYHGMKSFKVGALGARTTAFKTVRFDELTLQNHGITTETFDLSELFLRVTELSESSSSYQHKAETLRDFVCWKNVPDKSFTNIVKLAVIIDQMIEENQLDAIALRCWIEIEKQLKISPCVILSELNNRGIAAACELDVCNAVAMHALKLASGQPAACLDWNNNYGQEDDKCILFHCGPVPRDLMQDRNREIVDHPMFAKALGAGNGFGCHVGRLKEMPFTYASAKTTNGELRFYLGEGEITPDQIPEDFFGCAGVAQIDNLQQLLVNIGKNGYRHHVSLTDGKVAGVLQETFNTYLNYHLERW